MGITLPQAGLPRKPGSRFRLHVLAETLGLGSADFVTIDVIRGGMGVCIRVQHAGSGKEFALKTLDLGDEQRTPDHLLRRFIEEVKIWITLSSNGGVLPAYCVDRINEVPVVCAQWMQNGSLRAYLSRKSPHLFYPCIDRVVRTLRWASETHAAVHRDLKPDNILFDDTDLPYVGDWGVARLAQKHGSLRVGAKTDRGPPTQLRLTAQGSFLGTLLYASPEQIRDSGSVDHRSDIYSLGCIMFEWETGTTPFFKGTPHDIARAHLYQTPPKLGSWLKRSAFGAEDLIMKCLAKKPGDRFQNYDELIDALASASRKRTISWKPLPIRQSSLLPKVGRGEVTQICGSKFLRFSKDGKYALTEISEVEPYLKEAETLIGLGEAKRASQILEKFFDLESTRSNPDYEFIQAIAITYALCLTRLDRAEDAIAVLEAITHAQRKPPAYFVNLSHGLNITGKYTQAENVAQDGLTFYPNDADILGNLTIALKHQRKLRQAYKTALHRLELERNVHSLEEAATVFSSLGREERDRDWPRAVEFYRQSVELLREAKRLNPLHLSARYNLAKGLFDLEKDALALAEIGEFWQNAMHCKLRDLSMALIGDCMLANLRFKECIEFADKWLPHISDSVFLARVRAEAIVEGFVIGRERDGQRIVESTSLQFFENIVSNSEAHTPLDYCFLARYWDWMGKASEALTLLKQAETLFPTSYDVFFWETQICFNAFEATEAIPFAKEAVRRGGWQPSSWELFAKICDASDQVDEARNARQRASEIRDRRRQVADTLAQLAVHEPGRPEVSIPLKRGGKQPS